MPATIPYISPGAGGTAFAAPETRYSFHMPSHTFSGQNTSFMNPGGMEGFCSIVAKFNYVGELEHGSIRVVGSMPGLGIGEDTILLQGSIINVDTFAEGSMFRANFLFRIEQDHPALGYTSHIGIWNSYMQIPGWPEFYHKYLFRKSWGPHRAPLNSYIGQVDCIV
ncbi:MAG TPA: hypothetical protein ENJ17_05260 [Gammaproteobacteria bacterium]|nr:hypothetical protein [Gammaproteobacteria bacterium]